VKKSIEIQMPIGVEEDEAEDVDDEEMESGEAGMNIDLDLEDPELAFAATKIQAGYRGMKTRQETRQLKKEKAHQDSNEEPDHAGGTNKEDEEVIDIDLDDPEVEAAATKIQAGFKGHKARKEVKKMKQENNDDKDQDQAIEDEEPIDDKDTDNIDIDLDDPEVTAAATKIQAGYKGMRTRREVKKMKETTGDENKEKEEIDIDTIEKMKDEEVEDDQLNDETEIDIDLNDPEVEFAATKIQAGYKGMKARREVKKLKEDAQDDRPNVEPEIDIDMNDPEVELAATKIQAGYKGMRARREVKKMKMNEDDDERDIITPKVENQEDEIDIDLNDPEVDQAASKIQAGYKGMRARKEVRKIREEKEKVAKNQIDENFDIDLDDPEVNIAATKIQAGYKGMRARKDVKKMKDNQEEIDDNKEEQIDIDLNDPEVEMAATKIQAGYKGMRDRKKVRSMKNKDENDDGDGEHKEDDQVEEMDIDLNDPDVEVAATKIQAGYKGMKTRQEMKKRKEQEKEVEEDNEFDIDLNDPETEMAATKIQAGYKGMKTRREMKKRAEEKQCGDEEMSVKTNDVENEIIDIDMEDPEVELAATKIQAGYKGMRTRKEMKQRKAEGNINDTDSNTGEIDIDLDDPEVEAAATKIQAGFKGHKARKEVRKMREENLDKEEDSGEEDTNEMLEQPGDGAENIDIDLDDPDVEAAATKIQAGFKGHKARKEVKKMKQEKDEKESDQTTEADKIDIDLDDPEVEAAATKIQAGFKGHKARKEVKKMKEENKEGEENLEAEEVEKIDIDLDDPDVEAAATKIQAGFKGHKARQEVKKMKIERQDKNEANDEDQMPEQGGESDEEKAVEDDVDKIDINLDDPEVEAAATKIQAGFKGHKARKEVKKMKNERDLKGEDQAAEDVVGKSEQPDVEIDINLDDPEVEAAATKIQAGFKGHQARKEVKKMKEELCVQDEDQSADNIEKIEQCEEDKIDINLDDPEVEAAATKIQAGFKGHQARKEVKKMKAEKEGIEHKDKEGEDEIDGEEQIDVTTEVKEIDIDLDDPEVEAAATKIQAGFKGHKARQEVKKMKAGLTDQVNKDVVDGDLDGQIPSEDNFQVDENWDTEEAEQAAIKIQSGYKGMQARKEVKRMREDRLVLPETEITQEDSLLDIDLTDPNMDEAAAKIQAGFRGMKTRKELKAQKDLAMESINEGEDEEELG